MRSAIRYALGIATIVTIVHGTVATPTAAAQAAKPNACELVDAAELLKLTGRKDPFGKGPQVQALATRRTTSGTRDPGLFGR